MTETIESMPTRTDQLQFAQALVEQAGSEGVELIGPGGLLTRLTRTVLETALEAEITDHHGYDKHDPVGRNGHNSRYGTRPKTVLTEIGPVQIELPRDRDGTFEPSIVRKRQLVWVDQIIPSLAARGLTTGEIAAHFAEVYGATVSKDTFSKVTDKVPDETAECRDRPLDRVYPVVFIDAIMVKVRDGQVTNRPVHVAIGVTCNVERDILGLWAGDGGECAKFWLSVLPEIKYRRVQDVCIVVCDGRKGLPDSVTRAWPLAIAYKCVMHLLRNRFRFTTRRYWDELSKDLRSIYPSSTEASALARFEEFDEKSGDMYPAVIKLWPSVWIEFVPFLGSDIARRIIRTTSSIESINARYRRAIRSRGHFPTAGRPDVSMPGDQIARPHGPWKGPLGGALEAHPETPSRSPSKVVSFPQQSTDAMISYAVSRTLQSSCASVRIFSGTCDERRLTDRGETWL